MNLEDMTRRVFLGTSIKAGLLLLPKLDFANSNKNETKEELEIIKRSDWDELWTQLSEQYSKELGEKFEIEIGGEKRVIEAAYLSYIDFSNKNLDQEDIINKLKEVYQRIIVHHTELKPKGDSIDQVKLIRNSQIVGRNFNDIAYNFIITTDGSVYFGRPLTHIGLHAGYTKESKEIQEKYFKRDLSALLKAEGTEKEELMKQFVQMNKMDPDYGSIGVALCGDFNKSGVPTDIQKKSLETVLNYLKQMFDIPTINIIGHNEVKEKVIEASGLTLGSSKKTCPGKGLGFEDIVGKLEKDTAQANNKSITLTF